MLLQWWSKETARAHNSLCLVCRAWLRLNLLREKKGALEDQLFRALLGGGTASQQHSKSQRGSNLSDTFRAVAATVEQQQLQKDWGASDVHAERQAPMKRRVSRNRPSPDVDEMGVDVRGDEAGPDIEEAFRQPLEQFFRAVHSKNGKDIFPPPPPEEFSATSPLPPPPLWVRPSSE